MRRRRLPIATPPDLRERLVSLVRSTPWLLEVLQAARLTDWLGPTRVTPRFRTPLERELIA